jgi:hypothetical protein
MATVTFDTDELIQKLIAVNLPPEQARTIVRVMVEAQTQLATKADLEHVEQALRHEMREIESRMTIKLGAMMAMAIGITAALVKIL